jgi:hypothetical protein
MLGCSNKEHFLINELENVVSNEVCLYDNYESNTAGLTLTREEAIALRVKQNGSNKVQFNWGQHGSCDGWFASGVLVYPNSGDNFHLSVRIISSIQ